MISLPSWTDHQIAILSLLVSAVSTVFTIVAALAALIGIPIAVHAIRRGNKNASAATVVTLYDGLRQAWQRFESAPSDGNQRYYELAELMNFIEIACGIHFEGSLVGVSSDLMKEYLKNSLSLIRDDEYALRQIAEMLHSPKTFEHIRKFIGTHAELSDLLETRTASRQAGAAAKSPQPHDINALP